MWYLFDIVSYGTHLRDMTWNLPIRRMPNTNTLTYLWITPCQLNVVLSLLNRQGLQEFRWRYFCLKCYLHTIPLIKHKREHLNADYWSLPRVLINARNMIKKAWSSIYGQTMIMYHRINVVFCINAIYCNIVLYNFSFDNTCLYFS